MAFLSLHHALSISHKKSNYFCNKLRRALSRTMIWERSYASSSLYTFGKGYLGILGHGNYEDHTLPKPLEKITNVSSISAGWAHSAVLLESGELLLFGRSHDFEKTISLIKWRKRFASVVDCINYLGGVANIDVPVPSKVDLGEENAIAVACSAALTAIATASGKVLCFGSNRFGQCGIGSFVPQIYHPSIVQGLENERIVDVSAGFQHILALSESGKIFSWGKGDYGQLGSGVREGNNIAKPIYGDQKFKSITTGFATSAAITVDGKLYTWGKFGSNELDSKNSPLDQIIPRLITTKSPVVQAVSSQFHLLFLTEDGKLWALGRKKREMTQDIRNPLKSLVVTEPQEVHFKGFNPSRIKKLCRGQETTGIITESGEVYRWSFHGGMCKVNELFGVYVNDFEEGWEYSLVSGDSKK